MTAADPAKAPEEQPAPGSAELPAPICLSLTQASAQLAQAQAGVFQLRNDEEATHPVQEQQAQEVAKLLVAASTAFMTIDAAAAPGSQDVLSGKVQHSSWLNVTAAREATAALVKIVSPPRAQVVREMCMAVSAADAAIEVATAAAQAMQEDKLESVEDLLLYEDEPFSEGPAADAAPQATISAIREQSQEGGQSQSKRREGPEDPHMSMLRQIQQGINDNREAQAKAAREQAQAAKEQSKRLEFLEDKLKRLEGKRSRSPSHREDRREPYRGRRHN